MAGIRASIEEDRKALAFDLLRILTSPDVLYAAIMPAGENDSLQFLLPARISVFDRLSAVNPVYSALKDLAVNPENQVLRIGPDGRDIMEKTRSALPALVFGDNEAR